MFERTEPGAARTGDAARGQIVITESDLRRMFPRGREDYIAAILAGRDVLARHGIAATAQRWCAFIANVAAETGGLTIVRENMNYTAVNLLAVWSGRYPNTVSGRAKARAHASRGAKFIANYNYGFRLGNRGRNTDDGWNYRGALLLQATGRTMALWLQEMTGRPYADVPETFNVIDAGAVEIAALTWCKQGLGDLNAWADRGAFRACCNGINRGNPRSERNPIGWRERQAAHKRAVSLHIVAQEGVRQMQFTEIPFDDRPIIVQLQMNDTFGIGRIAGRHRTTMERDQDGNIYAVWKFEDGRVARIMATPESVYQEPSEWSDEIARQLGVTSV